MQTRSERERVSARVVYSSGERYRKIFACSDPVLSGRRAGGGGGTVMVKKWNFAYGSRPLFAALDSSSCSFDLLRKKKGFSMEKSILVSRLTREKVERKAITQEIEHYFFPLSLPFFLVLRSHSERITCRRFFFL